MSEQATRIANKQEIEIAEEAAELLARRLYDKIEHLNPSNPPSDWAHLSEFDRDYYETLIENLLMADDLIKAALSV